MRARRWHAGSKYEEEIGANPFKFGMIGSTDSHTSLATTREDNFFGKASITEPGTAEERYEEFIVQPDRVGEENAIRHYETLAAGLAAAWARENTREAIWDAFQRKEVYATTGSRMVVRVFAGWDFEADEVHRPDFAAEGYARGVPMGADLFAGPEGAAPTFMIRALRDVDGANLDRIQMVKGWVGADGKPMTKVFDVSWSGDREPGRDGKLPPVGSTVEGAEFTNTIGAAVLGGYWVDPRVRPRAACLLLRARAGDPDTVLAGLRQGLLRQYRAARGRGDGAAGTGLHLADLVHAKELERRRSIEQLVLPLALAACLSAPGAVSAQSSK